MRTLVLAIAVFALGAVLGAQQRNPPSLGAVAKAAQEEKAKAKPAEGAPAADQKSGDQKTEKTAAKKYSNETLDGRPGPSSSRPSPKLTSASGTDDGGNTSGTPKDQAYWRSRADEVRQRVQYSKDKLNAAKAELERSRTSGPLYIKPADRATSSVEAERNRLSAEVRQLEADARREEQAMTQLEEDARRAGVPPGWLR
jgi:hypothetical protein